VCEGKDNEGMTTTSTTRDDDDMKTMLLAVFTLSSSLLCLRERARTARVRVFERQGGVRVIWATNGNDNDTITAITVIASSLSCKWKEEVEERKKWA